jgi:2,4-dienoyl-CoA reductase-like NADH-dependent reductase (Old Yellow Enzyme family)
MTDPTARAATTRASRSPFEPAALGPLKLKNRIIKAATFEGGMPRGAVSQDLIDFHTAVAAGGAAMTTVAYCAVSMNGRVSDLMVFTEDHPRSPRLTVRSTPTTP